uniref:Uncharacterized protein n=1 Tax=Entomoneis paludosa TaxID=265537 RepID=A0A7S2YQA5_9STRA
MVPQSDSAPSPSQAKDLPLLKQKDDSLTSTISDSTESTSLMTLMMTRLPPSSPQDDSLSSLENDEATPTAATATVTPKSIKAKTKSRHKANSSSTPPLVKSNSFRFLTTKKSKAASATNSRAVCQSECEVPPPISLAESECLSVASAPLESWSSHSQKSTKSQKRHNKNNNNNKLKRWNSGRRLGSQRNLLSVPAEEKQDETTPKKSVTFAAQTAQVLVTLPELSPEDCTALYYTAKELKRQCHAAHVLGQDVSQLASRYSARRGSTTGVASTSTTSTTTTTLSTTFTPTPSSTASLSSKASLLLQARRASSSNLGLPRSTLDASQAAQLVTSLNALSGSGESCTASSCCSESSSRKSRYFQFLQDEVETQDSLRGLERQMSKTWLDVRPNVIQNILVVAQSDKTSRTQLAQYAAQQSQASRRLARLLGKGDAALAGYRSSSSSSSRTQRRRNSTNTTSSTSVKDTVSPSPETTTTPNNNNKRPQPPRRVGSFRKLMSW